MIFIDVVRYLFLFHRQDKGKNRLHWLNQLLKITRRIRMKVVIKHLHFVHLFYNEFIRYKLVLSSFLSEKRDELKQVERVD